MRYNGSMSIRLCECGCGETPTISNITDTSRGWKRGEPRRFVKGHRSHLKRLSQDPYREEDRGYTTPCWIWLRTISHDGYAQQKIIGESHVAHKNNYMRKFGPVPNGKVLDHLCKVRCCVNPDHLEVVSHTENLRRRHDAKLDRQKVNEIKALRGKGKTLNELAAQFNVQANTISRVLSGVRWSEDIN
jgi:hypothetical protein